MPHELPKAYERAGHFSKSARSGAPGGEIGQHSAVSHQLSGISFET
jgi:hypothetical protein